MVRKITKYISDWYTLNKRALPWRVTKDPYKIWVSEIILQQTRIGQGTPYYINFIQKFPDIHSLANAPADEVMRQWQGLGYYSRARNMHETAKEVVKKFKGLFPSDYKELIRLKGIGEYTVAVILSVCFNKPYVVLDGNVFRVLARLYGSGLHIDSPAGKKYFREKAERIIDQSNPGDFNEAMMELGAIICLPSNPLCQICPVRKYCLASKNNVIHEYPKKLPRKPIKSRYLNYFLISNNKSLILTKRQDNDIWRHLYELPLIEKKSADKISKQQAGSYFKVDIKKFKYILTINHLLTHRKLTINFYQFETKVISNFKRDGFQIIDLQNLDKYAFPKPLEKFLTMMIKGIK